MIFSKTKLLAALSKCMPGVSTGSVTLEGADSFVFSNGFVHTYNAEVSVSVRLDGIADAEFPFAIVNAKDLYATLNKLPEDQCEIELGETTWTIKCKRIKAELKLAQYANILDRFANLTVDETKWNEIDGVDFNTALKNCFIPSNKSSFAGVFVKDNIVVATNQAQVNVQTLKHNYPQVRIGNDAVRTLLSWTTFKKVQYNKTWLQFADEDGTIFSVKTLMSDAEMFDRIYSIVAKTESLEKVVEDKLSAEFFAAIDRASNFTETNEKEQSLVRLEFSGNGMNITSKKASGTYEELISDKKYEVDYDGNFDVRTLLSIRDQDATLNVFKTPSVPGKPTILRFEFVSGTFKSVVTSF